MRIAKTLYTMGSLLGVRGIVGALRAVDGSDVLRLVGLTRRSHPRERFLSSAALLAISAAVGAGTALLLTPMSGADLRRRIAFRASDVKERVGEKVAELEREIKEQSL